MYHHRGWYNAFWSIEIYGVYSWWSDATIVSCIQVSTCQDHTFGSTIKCLNILRCSCPFSYNSNWSLKCNELLMKSFMDKGILMKAGSVLLSTLCLQMPWHLEVPGHLQVQWWPFLSHICRKPIWHQTIIWTNVGLLLIGLLWTNFSETLFKTQQFLNKKLNLKMASAKWQPFCLSFNVLSGWLPCCWVQVHRHM